MPRVVVFDEFGGPEVLRIVDEPVPEPGTGEVRVRIEAFAVNPIDAMMRSGASPAPVPLPHARLGIEATGVVDTVGPEVIGLQPGEPVVVTAIPDSVVRGSYAEQITIPANTVVHRPAGLDVPQAAAFWVAYFTAYHTLVETAGIRPADRVLISGASGGVGRAAIQIAQQIGAVPIAVTRATVRVEELLSAGAAGVIATDRENVADAVHRRTGGTGVDVVLDLVRGPGQQDLLAATRPGGTLVAAGFLDPRPTPDPGETPVTVVNYRAFDHLSDPAVVRRAAAFLDAGVRLGALRPAVDRVFALDDVVAAHRRFDQGLHAGKKIVVTV
ncbi:alcohol dehydrogenase [Actinocatenispora thailandica]|uniref:Alcohol dehydrogenase n=1 Tax=Actinocatenispora thailandica TaxID=227318 RepID=A0A7R7HZ92_9ACTN|nr:zinc-dependent alcohol dehydrogenase family protein [Actinocatenispora thailandica]BCJ37099.1 alcohol dehydrogenase [Actinocatenispora thailandica]